MSKRLNLVFFLSLFLISGMASAGAANKVKSIRIQNENSAVVVELTFDHPVAAAHIRPTFERGFAQLALKNTVMDGARILPGGDSRILDKVFAYPYSADTVRVRLIGTAKDTWDKVRRSQGLSIRNASPRVIRIQVGMSQQAVAPAPAAVVASKPAVAPVAVATEDKELLKEVLTNTKEIDIRNPDAIKTAIIQDQPKEQGPVGVKIDPTKGFIRMAVSLAVVLLVFGGTVFLIRRFGLKKLPFGKKERIISVIATHYLGSKKSISLVKVAGEYMVLGTSNEGVSLISKLGAEINVDKYLEDRFWGGTFENHLKSFAKDVQVTKESSLGGYDGSRDVAALPARARPVETAVTAPSNAPNVRATIKEKLSKLKPLT